MGRGKLGVTGDPRTIIASSATTVRQKLVVGLCVILNGLDGFDVLSVSFAAPGISKEWGIDRASLGVVLSMELIGMAVGSIFLGQVADRVGRRLTTLICLCVMAAGMILAAYSGDPLELGAVRFMTGLGIGGLLASISAIAAGASSDRYKTMSVALMAAGYPLGAVIGGSISSTLLVTGDWRNVFILGAVLTATMLPLAYAMLPESFESLMRQYRGEELLRRTNRSLRLLGHKPLESLSTISIPGRPSLFAVVQGPLLRPTALLIGTYFLHMMSFYFMLKWLPKMASDIGLAAPQAASVLVWANVGGVAGSFLLSLLTARLSLRVLITTALLLSATFLAIFGWIAPDVVLLSWAAAFAGFSANAVIVGFYALIALTYPAHLRGSGTGLVIGLGRGGAALGPILGGALFASGMERGEVTLGMAGGSALAILLIFALFRIQQQEAEVTTVAKQNLA